MAGEIDTSSALANAGGIFTGIGSTVLWLFLLVLIVIVIYVVQKRGILVRRPYHVTVLIPWNNTKKIEHAWGRFLLGNKDDEQKQFEIAYTSTDTQKIAAPPTEYIFPDKQLFCVRKNNKDHNWVKDMEIDESRLKIQPTSDPSLVMAHIAAIREAESRFSKANFLLQYAPIIGLLVIGIMIAVAHMVGTAEVAKAYTSSAGQITSGYTNLAAKLENASIVIAKNPSVQGNVQPAPSNPSLPSFIPP